MSSVVVQEALAASSDTRSEQRRARRIAEGLTANTRPLHLRTAGFVFRKVFRHWFQDIQLSDADVALLRAAQAKGPVLLLPTHRSHLDYMVLTYLCIEHGLRLPLAIAGDNLNIPIVGPALRNGGAVFIRRSFGQDPLYKAVFRAYMALLLKYKSTIECFIEGGRSRSGKTVKPRTGFLQVVTTLLAEDPAMGEVTVVPMSISYDKVAEGASYVREMLGHAKEKESLGLVLATAQRLAHVRLRLGSIHVTVADPIPLREAMHQDPLQPLTNAAHRSRFVKRFSHRVMYHCERITTVSVTAMVAAVLLTCGQRGITVDDVCSGVEYLWYDLRERGATVSPLLSTKGISFAVESGLAVLRHLYTRHNDIVFGFHNIESLELSIYRNQLLHWFVSDCLVAVSLSTASSKGKKRGIFLQDTRFLSKLLKFEFIYKPAPGIQVNFEETIQRMQTHGLVQSIGKTVYLPTDSISLRHFAQLCRLIAPFIDTYWATAHVLASLDPDVLQNEATLARTISTQIEQMYYQGRVHFFDSMSVDAVSSALSWFRDEGFLTFRTVQDSWTARGQRLLHIIASPSALQSLASRIDAFRSPLSSRGSYL